MKRYLILLLCAVMAVSAAACADTKETPEETRLTEAEETQAQRPALGGMQIANPFTDCETMEEAEKLSGFPMTLPEILPDWAQEEPVIRAEENGMTELIYRGAEQQELRIRKAAGSEDISGDYETYEEVTELAAGELTLTVRSNAGRIYSAIWTADGCTYAVSCSEGMTAKQTAEMAVSVR